MLKILFILLAPWAIDGDTLGFRDADGQRLSLRLWGVQAPERHEAGFAEATRALAALIDGQSLDCDVTHPGSHGRFVGSCRLPDGRDLACEMIRAGHATEWRAYSRGAYAGCAP